ncbi:MAG: energy transducer TonB [Tannerellaceae bacterium]|nr:energy transducer TonB [Tannerellaceae bacterium]
MKLQEYIRGNRRGKEAHRLEREAQTDPFLSDALDGYIQLQEDATPRIGNMRKRIRVRTTHKRKGFQVWSAAAVVLLLLSLGVYSIVNPVEPADIYYSLSDPERFSLDLLTRDSYEVADSHYEPAPLAGSTQVVAVEPVPLFAYPLPIGGEPYVEPYLPVLNGDLPLTALDLPEVQEGIGKKPEPAVPAGLYKQYLADHIQIPIQGVCPRTKGKVTVSFKVNPTGRPYNIRVVKGLCESLDNEAVRLVREGPDWKFGDQEVRMTIQL